ncbi:MAG: Ig-like domain-containing protein, partial [Bacteroidales bacterium]|nr:Ig-like domain-containing protein [Bacteroidales bacterium]
MRTLTGVPQGWQVQAGAPLADVDSNADGSYSIEAGQPVRLVPSAEDKPRVKSVTLVDNSTPAAVLVESITLNKTATTITAGQTETLSVSSVTPDDATDQTVTWSSDNEAVATVDADGKVTA